MMRADPARCLDRAHLRMLRAIHAALRQAGPCMLFATIEETSTTRTRRTFNTLNP